jgi:RNA-directed DNA polymerase
MNSSRFEKKQLQYLASLLNCPPNEILQLCEEIESYYYHITEQKFDKTSGKPKTYSDGSPKMRVMKPSLGKLKKIQTAIKNNILSKIKLPNYVQGGVKGKSNITNAHFHKGNKYFFTTDLKDFFPTIDQNTIYELFLSKFNYSNYIARWLTRLTSFEFELPQGTPTSTHIANLVFLQNDLEIEEICKKENIKYTRFVDDLAFSSQKDFKLLTEDFLDIIRKSKFKINHRKTKYGLYLVITGLNIYPNYVDVQKSIKDRIGEEKLRNITLSPLQGYLKNVRKMNTTLLTRR